MQRKGAFVLPSVLVFIGIISLLGALFFSWLKIVKQLENKRLERIIATDLLNYGLKNALLELQLKLGVDNKISFWKGSVNEIYSIAPLADAKGEAFSLLESQDALAPHEYTLPNGRITIAFEPMGEYPFDAHSPAVSHTGIPLFSLEELLTTKAPSSPIFSFAEYEGPLWSVIQDHAFSLDAPKGYGPLGLGDIYCPSATSLESWLKKDTRQKGSAMRPIFSPKAPLLLNFGYNVHLSAAPILQGTRIFWQLTATATPWVELQNPHAFPLPVSAYKVQLKPKSASLGSIKIRLEDSKVVKDTPFSPSFNWELSSPFAPGEKIYSEGPAKIISLAGAFPDSAVLSIDVLPVEFSSCDLFLVDAQERVGRIDTFNNPDNLRPQFLPKALAPLLVNDLQSEYFLGKVLVPLRDDFSYYLHSPFNTNASFWESLWGVRFFPSDAIHPLWQKPSHSPIYASSKKTAFDIQHPLIVDGSSLTLKEWVFRWLLNHTDKVAANTALQQAPCSKNLFNINQLSPNAWEVFLNHLELPWPSSNNSLLAKALATIVDEEGPFATLADFIMPPISAKPGALSPLAIAFQKAHLLAHLPQFLDKAAYRMTLRDDGLIATILITLKDKKSPSITQKALFWRTSSLVEPWGRQWRLAFAIDANDES